MADDNKVQNIFKLMKLLVERKKLTSTDEEALDLLGCSRKTLGRYLKELITLSDNIIEVKQGKGYVYELMDTSYVFEKIMQSTDDFSWFFDLVDRWDSSIFQDMDYELSKKERDVFLYKNSPFEEFVSDKQKDIFRSLKSAIINKEYRDISYVYDAPRIHKQAIPLKLIFMEQNWYVAIIDQDTGFRFLRVFFIKEVKNSAKRSFMRDISKKELKAYGQFLSTFQNPMSRYDKPLQVAHLKASPKIAKYFDAHMKKHFISEKFIKKNHDGSVEFSLEYTQSIEILPFVKKWLPDLKILSPLNLKEELDEQLKAYLG